MANKLLFGKTLKGVPQANTVNEAGGVAYSMSDKHALAQLATTGTLGDGFYISAQGQLDQVIEVAKKIKDDRFLAKTAVYARNLGYMKDMPALLTVLLSSRNAELCKKIFPRIIDNGKMIRNFVQMVQSGKLGRTSMGSVPKKLTANWLNTRTPEQILNTKIGNNPTLADIIKLSHPKPRDKHQEATYAWILDKEYTKRDLPAAIKAYEAFKKDNSKEVPDVSFQLLTALPLSKEHWKEIARNAKWQMTRMNLNTFQRQGVFEDQKLVKLIAARLRDPEQIRQARIFPYQLLMAYKNTESVPHDIREALQDAMEVATENIPEYGGQIYVFPDVSGSMGNAVTGGRGSATSKCSCHDVAALIAASVVRKNRSAKIVPFESQVVRFEFNPRDSVMTNAEKMAHIGGGGTNCSAPLQLLNKLRTKADLVIYVSDNESWVDSGRSGTQSGTQTMVEWKELKRRCPEAKMVCIDLAANTSIQAANVPDVLNIGGFSDRVFDVIANFVQGKVNNKADGPEVWVKEIEKIDLDNLGRKSQKVEEVEEGEDEKDE